MLFAANQYASVELGATPPSPLVFADNVFPLFIASTATVFVPTILGTADMQLFIAGAPVEWMESTMNIDLILGALGKASFSIYSTTTYRPNVYDEVIFYRSGVRRFGGFVQSTTDSLIPGTNAHILAVNCVDFNALLNRVVIAKLYNLVGGYFFALDILLDLIVNYFAQFGVTYAGFATQGGVTGEVLFHYVTGDQAIAQLIAADPRFAIWIDSYKQIHLAFGGAALPGGFGTAPFSLSDTSRNYYDFAVTPDGTLYRNKQWVLPSANILSLRVETFTGDGATTSFITTYVLTQTPVVSVNGSNQIVATFPNWAATPGYTWYFQPENRGVFQRPGDTPLGVADTLTVAYPNPFALAISVQNDTEIARVGLVEAILQPQNVFDLTQAESIASGLLAAYCPNVPETIVFTTNEKHNVNWLRPGMTIPINKTIPAASGDYIVQEVVSQEIGLTVFMHTVTVRKNTGNLDPLAGALTLSQGALAATNNNATETGGFELAVTVVGLTNPGLATGAILNQYIFLYDGVLSFWSILFATDPPTGADMVIDALVNGVSILPSASALKIVLPAGQSTEEQGYLFASNNLAVKKGDILTLNIIQVGSVNPGTNGVVRIVTVR